MSAVWEFLTRTQGKNRLTWVDWVTYIYLGFGFLLIFLPLVLLGYHVLLESFDRLEDSV